MAVTRYGKVFVSRSSVTPVVGGKVPNFTLKGTPPAGWESWFVLSAESLPDTVYQGLDVDDTPQWKRRDDSTTVTETLVTRTFTVVQPRAAAMDAINLLRSLTGTVGLFLLTVDQHNQRTGEWWPASTFTVSSMPSMRRDGYSELGIVAAQWPTVTVNLDTVKLLVSPTGFVGRFFNALFFDGEVFAG